VRSVFSAVRRFGLSFFVCFVALLVFHVLCVFGGLCVAVFYVFYGFALFRRCRFLCVFGCCDLCMLVGVFNVFDVLCFKCCF
jgi:hypothetical protein